LFSYPDVTPHPRLDGHQLDAMSGRPHRQFIELPSKEARNIDKHQC
jgi:hypothetical protein